jgi:hypothetical protein
MHRRIVHIDADTVGPQQAKHKLLGNGPLARKRKMVPTSGQSYRSAYQGRVPMTLEVRSRQISGYALLPFYISLPAPKLGSKLSSASITLSSARVPRAKKNRSVNSRMGAT